MELRKIYLLASFIVQLTIASYKDCQIKKSLTRVSHDCVAEPECRERCGTVNRQECEIIEDEECVTETEVKCDTREEEMCVTENREECSETVSRQCETQEREVCDTVRRVHKLHEFK